MSEPITHIDMDNCMTIHHKGTGYFDSTEQGEVDWYTHPKGESSRAVSGFSCKILQWGHDPEKPSSHKASMQ